MKLQICREYSNCGQKICPEPHWRVFRFFSYPLQFFPDIPAFKRAVPFWFPFVCDSPRIGSRISLETLHAESLTSGGCFVPLDADVARSGRASQRRHIRK